MNRLYIIDGHSLLYKAYYAIRGLSTHSGTPTNAVFGFVNMLHRVIRECHAKFLCVTFDSGKPSFRVQIYPEYKANRPEMPQDLQIQIPIVFRLVDAMGIKRIVMDGYEADDLIATLCHHAEEQGWETRIVTADKDLFQLVTSRTHVLRFTKDTIEEYDPEAVRAKMGVPPERIADLLGLMGDSTDNIPGISGIGPKTASNLLRDHGDLETVLKNAAGLKNPRMKEKLLSGAESARLSLQLATVARDIPLEANLVDFAYTEHLTKDLESLLTDLEFRSLLSQMKKRGEPAPAEPPAPTAGQQYRIIRTVEELQVYVDNAVKIGTVAIDTETTSLDTHTCALVGVSLSFHTGEAVYIPVGHDPMMAGGKQISLDEL
ncbi:MAG TPA: 5'-3' exonuclease H3TH domain-containing protein, partial [Candidatus Sumerlaeota bacterium]|nr:5'-3' exonuclease H3TH domain-containing protein [Candidatus Sumerlaeota bacterium]